MASCSGLRRGHSGSALQITGWIFDSKTKNHLQMLLSVFRVGAALADDFIFYKIPLCRKPLPLGEVSSLAMTERASLLRQSHLAAISCPFVRAILSRSARGSPSAPLPSQALRAKAGLRHPASASLPLASCWPLSQQLLPVSAAGGGRRRCSQRESLHAAGKPGFQYDLFLLSRKIRS